MPFLVVVVCVYVLHDLETYANGRLRTMRVSVLSETATTSCTTRVRGPQLD